MTAMETTEATVEQIAFSISGMLDHPSIPIETAIQFLEEVEILQVFGQEWNPFVILGVYDILLEEAAMRICKRCLHIILPEDSDCYERQAGAHTFVAYRALDSWEADEQSN